MSSINVGIIFALETSLPKYQEILKLSGSKNADQFIALKKWKIFYDYKPNDEIWSYLNMKKSELNDDLVKLVTGDKFYEIYFWMEKNMVDVRKIFREYVKYPDRTDIKQALESLPKIQNKNIQKELFKIKNIVNIDMTLFELESELDQFHLKILKNSAGLNKRKRGFVKIIQKQFELSSEKRLDYLTNDTELNLEALDLAQQQLSESEVKYTGDSLLNVNYDLVFMRYMLKIKFLFYNLQLMFMDFSEDKTKLFINYDLY